MRNVFLILLLIRVFAVHSQTTDSLYHQLPEAEFRFSSRSEQLRLLSSESIIDSASLQQYPASSVVSAVNAAPGVRMEERSPGSYRLSVRGSLLRSPFGVRNVKIYLGDLPFTDAGGNTYLNSLDLSNVQSLRILKGPESSLFGANTGGVMLIDPVPRFRDSLSLQATVGGGSFGLFQENISFQKRWKKSDFNLIQGFQRSDGYRQQSAMHRHFIQVSEKWGYSPKGNLKLLAVFSDLFYETPGGLTLQQYTENPRLARSATPTLPGAETQKASIFNRTIFGGITHELRILPQLKHVISIFGGHTDFKNPFITNFEERTESTLGARTYFDLSLNQSNHFSAKLNVGGEWQQTNSKIENFGNLQGNKTDLLASDDLQAQQGFFFARALVDLYQKILLEASLSYNLFNYDYQNHFPFAANTFSQRNFNPQLMPGMAASWSVSRNLSWRASIRSGYSAPTLAEVRSSNNLINTELEAEKGISYETGLRFSDKKEYIWVDISVFYFQLNQAIVRRQDDAGNEFFVNAGGTAQPGIEGQVHAYLVKPKSKGVIRSFKITANATYNQFVFTNYRLGATDYSGKRLTGVPKLTSAETISISFPYHLNLFAQYYYASEIPLNDANSVYAAAYHLVQVKGEWKKIIGKVQLVFFAGVDNLLDQKYSLGNDLNAVGNRYYNAAASRNYYGGIKMKI